MTHDMSIFSYVYLPLYILSDEVSIKVSGPFLTGFVVFLLLSFKSSLYILDKSFIKQVFCKYFF